MTPEEIKSYREQAGMTQEDLADALKVRARTVGRWENGATTPMPLYMDALEVVLQGKPTSIRKARKR